MSDHSTILPQASTVSDDAKVLLAWATKELGTRARVMAAAYLVLSKLAEGSPGARRFVRELDLVWMNYLAEQIGAPVQKRGNA